MSHRNDDAPTGAGLAPAHVDCHAIFGEPAEDTGKPWTPIPSAWILRIEVRRWTQVNGSGSKPLIATYMPEDLPDLENLRARHGGGVYELTARASEASGRQKGSNLRTVSATLDGPPIDTAAAASTALAAPRSAGLQVAPIDAGSMVGGGAAVIAAVGGILERLATASREEREERREREEKRDRIEREERQLREDKREKLDALERERKDRNDREDAQRRERAEAASREMLARVQQEIQTARAAAPAPAAAAPAGALGSLDELLVTKKKIEELSGTGDLVKLAGSATGVMALGHFLGMPPELIAAIAAAGGKIGTG